MIKKIFLTKSFLMPFLSVLLLWGSKVSAQFEQGDNKLPSPFKDTSVDTLFEFINFVLYNIVIPIGTVVAVLFFIYSGFMFVTARGSEDKLATAKKAFLGAVIGTAILLGSVAISLAIQGTICEIMKIPGVCNVQLE